MLWLSQTVSVNKNRTASSSLLALLLLFYHSEYFLRAHELRDKQTIIKQKIEEKVTEDQKQQGDDSDSDDFEDFFDWRAKKAL